TAAPCAALTVLALLSSCASKDSEESPRASSGMPTTQITLAPTPAGPQTKNWFDLKAGDCLTEIPAVDTGAVETTVVDCGTPHQAEVFLLAPLAVNTAIDQVAMEKCA